MAFLLTWVTYKSWLPGDPRGFRSHKGKNYIPPPVRYAGKDTQQYSSERFKGLYEFHSGSGAVRLDETQREKVVDIVIETIREFCPGRAAVCVGETHAHVLLELGGRITSDRFCNFAKGRSARKLISLGHNGKVWARRFHARHIDSAQWDSAKQYILNHETSREILDIPKPRGSSPRKDN